MATMVMMSRDRMWRVSVVSTVDRGQSIKIEQWSKTPGLDAEIADVLARNHVDPARGYWRLAADGIRNISEIGAYVDLAELEEL